MSVARAVRKWRKEQGLSERAAADRIGVSQPTLRAVEKDENSRIGIDVAAKFVKALDGAISLEDFIRRRRSIPPAA